MAGLVWPRKYVHTSFSSLVQSLIPKDTLLRTYFHIMEYNMYSCMNVVSWFLSIAHFITRVMRLCICALRSPAGKGLTSWLSLVMSNC